MLAGAMNAQVATLPEGYYDYFRRGTLPKAFSSDGKAKFLATEELEEDGNVKIHIYNSSFNAEHSFEAIPQRLTEKKVTELRAVVATPGEFVTFDTERLEQYVPWNQASQEEKIAWLRKVGRDFLRDNNCYDYEWDRDSIYTNTNGDVYIYLINREYDYSAEYDVERVIGAFVLSGETLKIQPITYPRTGEWEVVDTDEYEGINHINFLEDVIDINNDWGHEIFHHPLIATQTLFNTDSKYEYIRYKQVAYSNRAGAGWDTDGDAIPDKREVWSGYDRAGIEIVSEDGNVIGSFDVDGEISGPELILWGEKRYLGFNVYGEDNDSYQIYEINPNGSGITRASSAAFMHILPAMPKKNTSVTVEFGEESVKKGGQLMITDMNGRTVYRNAVAPGETSVRVPLRRIESGVYNVTLTNDGKKMETSKLIVR